MGDVLYAIGNELFSTLFDASDTDTIEKYYPRAEGCPPIAVSKDFMLSSSESAQVMITSWGSAVLDWDVIQAAPELKLLVHAAGSVKPVVSDALWSAGVRVVSCAAAIAYGVAEYCLGLMLTECKRTSWVANDVRKGQWQESMALYGGAFELYRQKIGVIGSGFVGTRLIELLRQFECRVMLYDPYCTEAKAQNLGVTKVNKLDEIFSQCRVVTLNAPATEETIGMIKGEHFAQLPDGSLFLNTARNAVINEAEFIAELRKGRFVACLDVTDPIEPPPADHPYRNLPNVLLTPHIAGVFADNRKRMGSMASKEIEAFALGHPLKYEVTRESLHKIA